MNLVFFVLGIVVLLVVLTDGLWTVLWVDGGAGPVSSRLTTWLWRGLLRVAGRRHHRALSLFGPAILSGIVLMWVLLLWAGWTFVFAADPNSLLDTRDQSPANWTGRIYFVAYTMFTMGNGDFTPNGGIWQIVASLTNGSGMLLVTLAVTYVLSVISAVVTKRAFASTVTSLGGTAEAFVINAWNGDFRTLDLTLNDLSTRLGVLTEQYLAYPILQYYHAAHREKSPAIALEVLDEALTLLRYGVPERAWPNPVGLRSARAAVASFLDTLESAFIRPAEEPPAAPDLSALQAAGIPTVDEGSFQAALDEERERRRELLGLVRNDGWHWSDGRP